MFLFYVLSIFKKGDTIQGGTLFKGGHYMYKEIRYLIIYHECNKIGGYDVINKSDQPKSILVQLNLNLRENHFLLK